MRDQSMDGIPEEYKKFMALQGKAFYYIGEEVMVEVSGNYENGRVVLKGYNKTGELIAVITKNISAAGIPDDEHVFLNDQKGSSGLMDSLVKAGIVEYTGKMEPAGYTTYPLVKLLLKDKSKMFT
jgi:hypothetical protein